MDSAGQFRSSHQIENRLAVALPVKVISNEIGVAPQLSCTSEISRRVVRLRLVRGVFAEGQEIWLKHHNIMAKYRVIWMSSDQDSESGQFEAECMEDVMIWDKETNYRLKTDC
ncbi:MAG TPA: hypothetical protein VFK06_11040 [Candidatus Angelobacter sp.]|nr:hypothetical protein [Candidatus Angelobacter sp.]